MTERTAANHVGERKTATAMRAVCSCQIGRSSSVREMNEICTCDANTGRGCGIFSGMEIEGIEMWPIAPSLDSFQPCHLHLPFFPSPRPDKELSKGQTDSGQPHPSINPTFLYPLSITPFALWGALRISSNPP